MRQDGALLTLNRAGYLECPTCSRLALTHAVRWWRHCWTAHRRAYCILSLITRLRNDLQYVDGDVKPYSLTLITLQGSVCTTSGEVD